MKIESDELLEALSLAAAASQDRTDPRLLRAVRLLHYTARGVLLFGLCSLPWLPAVLALRTAWSLSADAKLTFDGESGALSRVSASLLPSHFCKHRKNAKLLAPRCVQKAEEAL